MRPIQKLLLICITIIFFVNLQPTKVAAWEIDNVTFIPGYVGGEFLISTGGVYIVQPYGLLYFREVNPAHNLRVAYEYSLSVPKWLNGTIVYRRYVTTQTVPPEIPCPDQQIAFGHYTAPTDTLEIFCLTPPSSYTDTFDDVLTRNPFDTYSALLNNRYLLNLRAGTWVDLPSGIPVTVQPADTLNWIAHEHTWWNPSTGLPMARIDIHLESGSRIEEIANEELLLCPVQNEDCQTLVSSVQSYAHGQVRDVTLTEDGSWLMWVVVTFPPGQPIVAGEPIGLIEDVIAFATDVQTGETNELFRLSEHNTLPSKGTHPTWTEDGNMLAIRMEPNDRTALSGPSSGLLLVQFTPPSLSPRVTDSLLALYTFDEGGGSSVQDTSGVGAPLNLNIPDPSRVTWGAGTLRIDSTTLISSPGPASKIIDAVRGSNALSVELWITPSYAVQPLPTGPARIVAISQDTSFGNLVVGQGQDLGLADDIYTLRLRTSSTNEQGRPGLQGADGTAVPALTHLVYTRDPAGSVQVYVNGTLATTGTRMGSMSAWNTSYRLALGNEFTLNRGWLGTYHLVAFYGRALSAAEVAQNHAAGAD